MPSPDAREQFLRIARLPDARIDLAEAALWIAAEHCDGLDVAAQLARLDELAERGRSVVCLPRGRAEQISRLNRFLFVEERFRGNRSDYYDPRNSFLNEVLERRTGIPITLAVVYLAVAKRLGLPVRGAGFPGHFLLRCDEPEILIDPFALRTVTRAECVARWHDTLGADATFDPRSLEATPERKTLARLIGNLKQIYLAKQDWPSALACVERILALEPDAPPELRDRGLRYARLECFAAAASDLRRFLELAPDDPTAPGVRAQLVDLVRSAPAVH